MIRLIRTILLAPTPFWRLAAFGILSTLVALLFILGQKPIAVDLFTAHWDKVAHLVAFFGFSGLVWVASGARSHTLVLVAAATIGFLDEYAQQFNPGRTVSYADWLMDMAGAVLLIVFVEAVRRLTGRRAEGSVALASRAFPLR